MSPSGDRTRLSTESETKVATLPGEAGSKQIRRRNQQHAAVFRPHLEKESESPEPSVPISEPPTSCHRVNIRQLVSPSRMQSLSSILSPIQQFHHHAQVKLFFSLRSFVLSFRSICSHFDQFVHLPLLITSIVVIRWKFWRMLLMSV